MQTPEFFAPADLLKLSGSHYDSILVESESSPKISFAAQVLHHLNEGLSVLAVCTHSPATLLFPLSSFAQKKLCIVDIFSGSLAFGAKGFWQHTDLLSAHGYGFTILETNILEDFKRFFALHDKFVYIRTTPQLVSEHDLPQPTYLDSKDYVLSFQAHGFAGSSYTLLGAMTSGIELMQAHRFLQEQHHSGDLFLTKSPFIVFPKELQESIKRTEKLIVVLDTLPTPLLSAWFHAQLSQSKLGDADLVLITPDYAHITSIAPEYLFEQGRFDGMSIAERIKKILD